MDWSVWTKGDQWPPKPHGFTWLMDAAERVAGAVIGEEWVGNEFAFEAQHMALNPTDPARGHLSPQFYSAVWFWLGVSPRGLTQVTEPSTEQWQQAYARWRWCFENADEIFERKQLACVLIHQAAERGEIVFYARNEATGEMIVIPRERWNCDTNIALARISRGRINLAQPMTPEPLGWEERQRWLAQMTSWLFVPEENLAAYIATIARGPALESAISRAAAEDECARWLAAQFQVADSERKSKPAFMAEAQSQITGLSGAAFNRAWAKVAAPGRKKAGAKRKLAG